MKTKINLSENEPLISLSQFATPIIKGEISIACNELNKEFIQTLPDSLITKYGGYKKLLFDLNNDTEKTLDKLENIQ